MDHLSKGASWVRADFHLHTRADKEFRSDREESDGVFTRKYVEQLKAEGVGVGVITNHNKLDYDEFNRLKKKARKEGILLLPGVELSVNDGARGIHCLIVFHTNWFLQGNNFAEQFLTVAFEGIPNRENENTRCNFSLGDLLTKLQEHRKAERDSFVILAHIEDNSGFCKELEGGRIQQLASNPLFSSSVLGMQKVRSTDVVRNLKQWFSESNCPLPAFVEGSDCKSLEKVGVAHRQKGQEKKSYIKIGDLNFDAVKFALKNHAIRIKPDTPPKNEHAHIKQIEFVGGKLNGKTIHFNADLNCLIGTPGAGKSSILETTRYILDIEFGDSAVSKNYKERVVENLLGSGGKGIATVVDKRGLEYRIERTLNEAPIITNDEGEVVELGISDSIISGLYFGQKDLSHIGDNFNQSFLDKFVGSQLAEVRNKIEQQQEEIKGTLKRLGQLRKVHDKADNLKLKIAEKREQIRLFEKYELADKLGRQKRFETDLMEVKTIEDQSRKELKALQDQAAKFERKVKKLNIKEDSQENPKAFEEVRSAIAFILEKTVQIRALLDESEKQGVEKIKQVYQDLSTLYSKEQEAFAEVRRSINVEGELKADDYLKYTRELKETEAALNSFEEELQEEAELQEKLKTQIEALYALHREEADIYQASIDKINAQETGVSIQFEPCSNKSEFSAFLQQTFQGTSLRKDHYEQITTHYNHPLAIFQDLDQPDSTLAGILSGGNLLLKFEERFLKRLSDLLTYLVPHRFELLYQDRKIGSYSVGERASALILFTLTMGDHDLIIIDQPEDDLNSQAIYSEVVETLLKSKSTRQFIFATHNPNIPVLGDCEQILCCQYFEDRLSYVSGGIDSEENQKNIIKIMEGGPEAFQKRTEIYSSWNG